MYKLLFMIIMFLFPSFVLCDVLEVLRENDNAMKQGTIVYFDEGSWKNQNNEPIKVKFSVIYSKTGLFKIKQPRNMQVYFDGENTFEVENNTKILHRENNSPVIPPNTKEFLFLFGRGLSSLDNIEIKDNILTGYTNNRKIVAYLDPNHDYLATKIERYSGKGNLLYTEEYSNPILVDGKYYIAGNIKHDGIVLKKYTIDSATFEEPKKEDYTFNEKKVDVLDNRQEIPVLQRNASDKSPEEIAKETQRQLEEYRKDVEKEKQIEKSNKIKKLMFASLSFIVLLIIVSILIKRFKYDKES